MNWRKYKRGPEGFKGLKGFNLPIADIDDSIKTLKTLKTQQAESKNTLPMTVEEICIMIQEVFSEINRQGYPWTGWLDALTPSQRGLVKELESRIDDACDARNCEKLASSLSDYRKICLFTLNQQRRRDR